MWKPFRRPWVRAVAIASGCAVVAGGVVLVGSGDGNKTQQVRLLAGSAWLSSEKVGQLTLLDGSSAEVAAQVQVASPGDSLKVVQQGSSAYAVNQTQGTIRRVDGASFDMSQPASPIPDAHSGLTAYAGPNVVYALDSQRGVLAAQDPKTLQRRSDPVPVSEQLSTGTATMDDNGRLWLIDKSSGNLVSYTDGQQVTNQPVAKPGNSVVTVANGKPVVVDVDAREAITVDPDTGKADKRFNLELRQGDQVQVSGSRHAPALYVVASRGVLNICDIDKGTCDHAVPLNAGSTYGAPVEAADRLFVPDYGTGEVWIVDLLNAKVLTKTQVLKPGGPFQLLARDGVVFFNDPHSEQAGVLQLDGTLNKVSKFDPLNPGKGLSSPGQQPTGQQQNPAQQQPGQQQPGQQQQRQPGQNVDQSSHQNTPPANNSNNNSNNNPGNNTNNNPSNPANNPTQQDVKAAITVSNGNPKAGQSVTLHVAVTPAAPIDVVDWTFGDGNGQGETVQHSWSAESKDQPYLVTAQVKLKDGRTATGSTQIGVLPKDKVALTVTRATGGKVVDDKNNINCGVACMATVDQGTNFHLVAQPDQDYRFDGWAAGPCKQFGTNPCDLTIGADNIKDVSATFSSTKVTLWVNVPTGSAIQIGMNTATGGTCESRCSYTFDSGADLRLDVQINPNYDFDHWTNGCADSHATQCNITADPARAARGDIVANFKPKQVTLEVHVGSPGKVTGTKFVCEAPTTAQVCRATYDYGTPVELTAAPMGTRATSFMGWYDFKGDVQSACQSIGDKNPCSLTLTKTDGPTTVATFFLTQN